MPEAEAAAQRTDEIGKHKATVASVALTMEYKGLQRASALDLTDDALGQLIIEAQVRDVSVGHLVSALIRAAMEKGLCHALDADSP
jgi:hypothetical protein